MDIISDSILIYNLPFTLFLGLQLIYWLFVLLGVLDIGLVDGFIDATDIDIDSNIETSMRSADVILAGDVKPANIETDIKPTTTEIANQTALSGLLDFFYVKKVPLIILTSIWTLAGWATSMSLNTIFNDENSILTGVLIYIPSFLAGFASVKIFGLPVSKIFVSLENDPDDITSVTGNYCTLITSVGPKNLGVAKVDTGKAVIQINVITHSGMQFNKGDKAIVIERNEEKNEYIIDKITTELQGELNDR